MLQRFTADMQLVPQNLGGNGATAFNRGSAREGKRNINAVNNLASGLVVVQKRKSHVAVSKYAANNEEGIFSEENSPRDQIVIASGMTTEEHQEYLNAITNTVNSIDTYNSKQTKKKHLQAMSISTANNHDVLFI
jgi:hypothetical protein